MSAVEWKKKSKSRGNRGKLTSQSDWRCWRTTTVPLYGMLPNSTDTGASHMRMWARHMHRAGRLEHVLARIRGIIDSGGGERETNRETSNVQG